MADKSPIDATLEDLYRALETKHGGVKLYETAITCAVIDGLSEDWQECLEQSRSHEQLLRCVQDAFNRICRSRTVRG